MSPLMATDKQRVKYLQQWIKGRRQLGKEPNADAIWNQIKRKWPTLPEDRKEAVFQAVH
jgi:hypothetical protein